MTHKNSPLTPEGRRRLCERIDAGRPIAHVAAEGGVSRQALTKWYRRWEIAGEAGLEDMTSRPEAHPNALDPDIVEMILQIREDKKWGAQRIAAHLLDCGDGIKVASSTVQRVLERHGMNRLRDLDRPTGESKVDVIRYEWDAPGDMIHVDVKKVGVIPKGGGWRAHGRDSEEALASRRMAARGGKKKLGYAYLHNAVDDHSRLAYTEVHYNETAETCSQFWFRAVLFYRAHGITDIKRCLTDNGSPYISHRFNDALKTTGTVHKRTRRQRPQTNGKVERYNQIMMAEWLYIRAYDSEESRTAYLADFLNYYNYERRHSGIGYQTPGSRCPMADFRLEEQASYLPVVDTSEFEQQLTLFEDE